MPDFLFIFYFISLHMLLLLQTNGIESSKVPTFKCLKGFVATVHIRVSFICFVSSGYNSCGSGAVHHSVYHDHKLRESGMCGFLCRAEEKKCLDLGCLELHAGISACQVQQRAKKNLINMKQRGAVGCC